MSRTPGVLGAARTSLALLLAATAGLAVGAVSPAAADASYAVPSDGVLRLTGHGYGHGKGLSQYGALGAATQGLTWQQIDEFYYPGTTWGRIGGKVRVLITGDTGKDVQVAFDVGELPGGARGDRPGRSADLRAGVVVHQRAPAPDAARPRQGHHRQSGAPAGGPQPGRAIRRDRRILTGAAPGSTL